MHGRGDGGKGLRPSFELARSLSHICTMLHSGKYMKARGINGNWAISHTEHDHTRFKRHTSATIAEVVNRLTEASTTLGKGAFKELQTRLGFHFAVGSVLYDAYTRKLLDPTVHCIFDWMHVIFVGGVFNVLMGLIYHRLRKSRIRYAN